MCGKEVYEKEEYDIHYPYNYIPPDHSLTSPHRYGSMVFLQGSCCAYRNISHCKYCGLYQSFWTKGKLMCLFSFQYDKWRELLIFSISGSLLATGWSYLD